MKQKSESLIMQRIIVIQNGIICKTQKVEKISKPR